MHLDDVAHRLGVGKLDIVEEAAAKESVGQFLLVVRRDDHDRAFLGLDPLLRLINVEAHAIEFLQQVVGKLDIGLVDLVDQQDGELLGGEGFPQLALLDVVRNVVDALVAQLAIAQAGHGVIFIQALLRLGGRFHVPFDQRRIERFRNLMRQHGLAGARLALDEQRAAQRHRRVDRDLEVVGGNVGFRTFETGGFGHRFSLAT